MFKPKKGERISPNMFLVGMGYNFPLLSTKFVRINKQSFSAKMYIKYHSHDKEWEIVLGGPKRMSVYPPQKRHNLKWCQPRSWSIISIKIGKKPQALPYFYGLQCFYFLTTILSFSTAILANLFFFKFPSKISSANLSSNIF